MTEINASLMAQLRVQIDAALQEVAAKNGVSIKLGNGKYNPIDAKFELLVLQEGKGLGDKRKDDQARKLDAYRHCFPSLDFDAEYVMTNGADRGKIFKITGYNPRAYKAPFVLSSETAGTKAWKVSQAMIDTYFKKVVA